MTASQPNDKRAARQSMRAALTESRARAASVPQPPQIRWAMIATAVQVVLGLVAAALSWGFTKQLTKLTTQTHKDVIINWAKKHDKGTVTYPFSQDVVDAYNKANPKALWHDFCSTSNVKDCFDVSNSVHDFRLQTTLATVVAAVLIVLLWARIRRGSGGARWGYVALSTIGAVVGMPLTIFYIGQVGSKMPKPIGVAQSLSALACLVALVLLVIRPSAEYFRAAREATGRPAAFGGRRPGGLLGGMMQPPPNRPSTPTTGTGENPAAGKAKAKVRTADAAAKGAELRRARAKAAKTAPKSKSRKNPDPTH